MTNGPSALRSLTAFALDAIDDRRRVRTPHGSFTIRVGNPIERWRADTLLTKEPETIEWLDRTLSPASVFFDVGANVGVYTLYAAHLFKGDIDIVCFEPEALNLARLNRNVFDNGYGARILCFSMGLGRKRGVSALRLSQVGAGRALHGERHTDAGNATYRQGIVVDALDSVLRAMPDLPHPTHMKIDVDGPELEILRGAADTLKDPRLRHVLIELADDEAAEAIAILGPCGFNEVVRGESIDGIANYIFEKLDEDARG